MRVLTSTGGEWLPHATPIRARSMLLAARLMCIVAAEHYSSILVFMMAICVRVCPVASVTRVDYTSVVDYTSWQITRPWQICWEG